MASTFVSVGLGDRPPWTGLGTKPLGTVQFAHPPHLGLLQRRWVPKVPENEESVPQCHAGMCVSAIFGAATASRAAKAARKHKGAQFTGFGPSGFKGNRCLCTKLMPSSELGLLLLGKHVCRDGVDEVEVRTDPPYDGKVSADPQSVADSMRVQRLKDLVLVHEIRAAITAGEFALRLRGAEKPGLVDYEELCNRLNTYIDRLERQPLQDEVLPLDEALKAQKELRETREHLQERLFDMTLVRCQVGGNKSSEPQVHVDASKDVSSGNSKPSIHSDPKTKQPREFAETNRVLLYLREDHTVDIDSALKESCSAAPISLDLWERLRGQGGHHSDDWAHAVQESPAVSSQTLEKQANLSDAKHELAKSQAMRTKILKAMGMGREPVGVNPQKKAEEIKELFRWDREVMGRRILVLLANIDLLFDLVAVELEAQLRQASIQEWDVIGRKLKVVVLEFSLLEKQMAPYKGFVREDPEVVRAEGLDLYELRMLELHIARIAERLGIQADCIGQETSWLRPIRHQWASMKKSRQKFERGIIFFATGGRLLYQDLQHAVKLMLKVSFLRYTLQPREMQVIYRAVKDLLVSIPVLVILAIPMSPPGHFLFFSLILKVFPDFFPSPFTERRQNIMRIYDEIKPVSERRKSWTM